MAHTTKSKRWAVASLSLASLMLSFTGCQVQVAGQTLPSPYYFGDDVQYFPEGPENKLARETAAQQAARAEARLQR